MIYIVITILFIVVTLFYFRFAVHFNITDSPNNRSSHKDTTIRGGGIIFLLAALTSVVIHFNYWVPMLGILIIGIISFLDDIYTLSSKLRLLFHLVAVTILFFYLNIFKIESLFICILLYIIVIGIINMYNFMDGINGITGAYSIVVLGGLQYVNLYQTIFVDEDLIWVPILACFVFLFFNFRKKARCFAGDVGSVTIAFWIILLLLRLIFVSGHWQYILFLVVYGVDSVLTIMHRLILKQNIFQAHRLHFYQLLVNEQKFPHLWVATGYAILQAIIIMIIVLTAQLPAYILFLITIIPLVIIYIAIKPALIRRARSTL